MATKQLTVVRPGRYGTRMLQAGDPLECTAPEARLYAKLGWATKAKRAAALSDPLNIPAASEETLVEAAKPAKRRRRKKSA